MPMFQSLTWVERLSDFGLFARKDVDANVSIPHLG